MIVERSAEVFNAKGYFGTSMSGLVRETGLEKGGIYNHFSSKEQLALETFDFSAELVLGRLEEALEGSRLVVVEKSFPYQHPSCSLGGNLAALKGYHVRSRRLCHQHLYSIS